MEVYCTNGAETARACTVISYSLSAALTELGRHSGGNSSNRNTGAALMA